MHQETPEHEGHEAVFPQIYDDLRRLASGLLAKEPPGQTLSATALVNEAYLRLARHVEEMHDSGT